MLDKLLFATRHPFRIARKYFRILRSARVKGWCIFCERESTFFKYGLVMRETLDCLRCRSNLRQRHLAQVLAQLYGEQDASGSMPALTSGIRDRSVYLAQSFGPLHHVLSKLPGYVCSEYFPDVPRGANQNGVRSEDLQSLTFANETFDLVITQEVFEHVREPDRAWREIFRVLKPGGIHLFTIPFVTERKTVRRVVIRDDRDEFILPPEYHGDDVRDGLVYTDFGGDLLDGLRTIGFDAQVIWLEGEFPPEWSCILVAAKPLEDSISPLLLRIRGSSARRHPTQSGS